MSCTFAQLHEVCVDNTVSCNKMHTYIKRLVYSSPLLASLIGVVV